MNQNKKTNGWILCPSKSFPGKFYYFNVLNGETAWSLNEIENQNIKRDYGMHKVADTSHSFPEPSNPPIDDSNFSNNSFMKKRIYNTIPKRVINNTQTTMFGQAVFPKYVDPYMPNFIWTPIQIPQIPHPMYMTNTPDMSFKMPMERMGPSHEPERSLLVQSCDLTLSKRFEMYSKQNSVVSNPGNRNTFGNFYETSTPIKSNFDGRIVQPQMFGSKDSSSFSKLQEMRSLIREPILKRVRTHSDSANDSRVLSSINKTNSAESLLNFENSALMKQTISTGNKVNNPVNIGNEKLTDLDGNDLRFLLVAKRRKSVDLGDLYLNSGGKKIKTTREEVPSTTPKKRVTFDLGVEASSDGESHQIEDDEENREEEMSRTDQNVDDGLVNIVVDIDTLLDEYDFIEEYLQSYNKRRLLIPHKLRGDIEAACRLCGLCERVIAARQLTRKLGAPPEHYVLLPEMEVSPDSDHCLIVDNQTDDYLLNTCLQVINSGDYVMLVTNNKQIMNDAISLNIDCFNTQQIKDGAGIAKPEVSFDLKKVKPNDNIFLKAIIENKNKDETKKRLFIEEDKINTYKDANTSPIGSELLNKNTETQIETRKNVSMPQTEKVIDNTTQIGLDMQNLFIKENPHKKQNVRFENGTEKSVSEPESTNINSLEDLLSVYSVKNKEIADNIQLRLDEWICCFTQIMENALDEIVMKYTPVNDKSSLPWVLYDSVSLVQDLYGTHTNINMVAEKFKTMLLNHRNKNGKLNSTIKPNEFVKIVGCGMILIESLKTIEYSTMLQEASDSLKTLLQNMHQPTVDTPLFTTPVLSRSERDTSNDERRNFVKNPSEIIDYLKTHFSDWKDFEISPKCDNENPKVVRTIGRDLNLLKIDINKSITMNTRTHNIMKAVNEVNKEKSTTKIDGITKLPKPNSVFYNGNSKRSPIVFRKFDNSFICKTNDTSKARKDINIIENVNLFDDKIQEDGNNIVSKTTESKEKPQNIITTDSNTEPKIIRLFDNLFNQKNITNLANDDLNEPKHGNTFSQNTETAGPKVIRKFHHLFMPKGGEKSAARLTIDDLNVPKHGHTFDKANETAGPKVIRNIKLIEQFEGKLKENDKKLDLDALDYTEIDESLAEEDISDDCESSNEAAMSFVYAIKNRDKKPILSSTNEKIAEMNDNALDNNDIISNIAVKDVGNETAMNSDVHNDYNSINRPSNDDATNDSGFENDSLLAYSFVKVFLAELSQSEKAIYEFIVKCINDFRNDIVPEENKKRMLHEKANRTQLIIADIIDKLKSIIQRESDEDTAVRSVLMEAGVQASSDKRMTRYRQVIIKCLEQAQVLENALKTVLAMTDNLDDLSNSSNHSNIRYFNIFE